jgi:HK97 family phage prohead protease
MRRTLSCQFKIKKAGKGSITIEGLANANTVDRMKEIILPSAWNLDNYKKNPVVLFDHGHDPTFGFMPIGRAVEVEARDEGLYTKIEMSSSKSEKISAVRDLVEEGILRSFSVGFDPKSTAKSDTNPDVMEITKAELIETSIVPIPMNQDSTFTMLSHRKSYWQTPLAKRWYDGFMDRVECIKKGAWVAAAVHQRLHDLIEVGEIRNKEAALKFVAEEAGATVAQVKTALQGKTSPIPSPMVKAFAGVLRVDLKTLEALNKGDLALLDRVMTRDEEGGDPVAKKAPKAKVKAAPPAKDPKKDPKDDPKAEEDPKKEDPKDDPKKDGEKAMGTIACVIVSKDKAASVDEAAKEVEAAGYAVDQPEETDQGFVFWQVPKDSVADPESGLTIDIGDGIQAMIVPADASAGKSGKDGKVATGDAADNAEDTAEGENPNEDAEEADEAKQTEELKKILDMLQNGGDPAEAADALSAVITALEEGEPDDPAKSHRKNIEGTDDNPYLKAAEGQTAMLGAILNELKGLNEGMKGVADLTVALSKAAGDAKGDASEDDKKDEGKDEEMAKSLDSLRDYQRDLDKKLKRLNV